MDSLDLRCFICSKIIDGPDYSSIEEDDIFQGYLCTQCSLEEEINQRIPNWDEIYIVSGEDDCDNDEEDDNESV